MKPPLPVRCSTNDWYKRNQDIKLLLNFRPQHPKSLRIHDLAIAAALDPRARQVFSGVLLEVFHYSWRALLSEAEQNVPADATPLFFIENEKSESLLHSEFMAWSGLFNPNAIADEPSLFKICALDMPEPLKKFWRLEDNVTPRVYRFEELAFNERNYCPYSDESEAEENEDLFLDLKCPNLGIQYPDDTGLLSVLLPGWGFDLKGHLTYKSIGFSEYERQCSLVSTGHLVADIRK